MHLYTQLVFDDFIVGETPVVTSPAFEEALGAFDRLSCQLVASTSSGSAKIVGWFEHSCDRRNYLRVTVANTFVVTVDTTDTTVLGFVAPNIVMFPFVRVAMRLDSPIIAQVKVWATGRAP